MNKNEQYETNNFAWALLHLALSKIRISYNTNRYVKVS